MLPQLTERFDWIHTAAGPALVCRALDPWAAHVFTTRSWRLGAGVASEESGAWDEVAAAIGAAPSELVRVRQVHGRGVVMADTAQVVPLPEGDIIIGRDPALALSIQTADCVPLLMVDRRTGVAAAVHAGWRGLAVRAPMVAVEGLTAALACRPADLVAAIGPAIGACCYEVGEDVRARFEEAAFQPAEIARWFTPDPVASPRNPPMRALASRGRPQHWFFDGWQSARDQLEAAGVPAAQVFVAGLCTASHPDVFCSYRRDGKGAGRLAGVIRPGKTTGAPLRP